METNIKKWTGFEKTFDVDFHFYFGIASNGTGESNITFNSVKEVTTDSTIFQNKFILHIQVVTLLIKVCSLVIALPLQEKYTSYIEKEISKM